MGKTHRVTDEQLEAYGKQRTEEKRTRAATPKSERIDWRQMLEDDGLAIAYIKHSNFSMPPKRKPTQLLEEH